jgi:hypothetical protein
MVQYPAGAVDVADSEDKGGGFEKERDIDE